MKSLIVSSLLLVTAASFAASPAQAAFEKLKSLEGTGEGKGGEKGEMSLKVIYKVTGGGSALIETQFPGTSHEMVTVYHLDGDKLVMTHYCAAQNQPTMKLIPSKEPNMLAFDFVSGTNMKKTDGHMHSMKMKLIDKNHIVSEWTMWSDGKPAGSVFFDVTRKN
jgi:hypothetical protein